jgi:hypothetical protein
MMPLARERDRQATSRRLTPGQDQPAVKDTGLRNPADLGRNLIDVSDSEDVSDSKSGKD